MPQTSRPSRSVFRWCAFRAAGLLLGFAMAVALAEGLLTLYAYWQFETLFVRQMFEPETEEAHPSPLEILIRFTPRQAPVDLSTLNVTLVKFFNIDLTDRVRPYMSPEGIHIQDAKLPSGEHTLHLTLADMDGGLTTEEISLRVM